MTVSTVTRRGERRLIVDIRYKNPDGSEARFRRDAEVQIMAAARAEERRRLAALALTGSPWGETVPRPELALRKQIELVGVEGGASATFTDVAKSFLTDYAPTAFKPSTIRGYGNVINKVLEPRLGTLAIESIDAVVARKLDGELVARKAKASTRRNTLIVLRSVLGYAVESKLLDRVPDMPALPKVGRTVLDTLSSAELEKVLAKSNPTHRLAFLLAADAGLRAGEVRGLRWSDVDLGRRRLVVRQSICRGETAPPKSGHQRTVPLTELLAGALDAVPKAARVGGVSKTVRGNTWAEAGLRQAFHRACKRAGVRSWRFHDLRHFFVTELFRAGVPANVAQVLAGHRELTTTQRYAHASSDDLVAAIVRLGQRSG